MINEFDCALKPKAYTKIVQASKKSIITKLLAVQVGKELFSSVSGKVSARPWPICTVILSEAFPWFQPSSQSTKTFLRFALTLIIFILVDLAAGILSSF